MRPQLFLILLSITLTIHPQDTLTIGEIYNYEIGDEFHSNSNLENQPPNASRKKVLAKHFSINKDTVFYQLAYSNYTSSYVTEPEPHLEYSFTYDTLWLSYTNLDSTINTSYVSPSECNFSNTLNEDFCQTQTNYFECIDDSGLGISGNIEGFGNGLGMVAFKIYEADAANGGSPTVDQTLFYFKKSELECGTPDNTTSIKHTKSYNSIKVYPNPSHNLVNIELTEAISTNNQLKIYTLTGQLITSVNLKNKVQEIDITSIEPGTYNFVISTSETTICNQVVKL